LREKDIPHCTTIRTWVMEIFEEYLDQLADAIQGSLGKISFTTDVWSDTNLVPFMAVTAHWI
ncbi:hypothetical protein BDN67DRAFT_859737, partial [Paxillus ammoniavirescens]